MVGSQKNARDVLSKLQGITSLGDVAAKCRSLGSNAMELLTVARGGADITLMFNMPFHDYIAGIVNITTVQGTICIKENNQWRLWEGPVSQLTEMTPATLSASHHDAERHLSILKKIEEEIWSK